MGAEKYTNQDIKYNFISVHMPVNNSHCAKWYM